MLKYPCESASISKVFSFERKRVAQDHGCDCFADSAVLVCNNDFHRHPSTSLALPALV